MLPPATMSAEGPDAPPPAPTAPASPPRSPGSDYGFYDPSEKPSPEDPSSSLQPPVQSPFDVISLGHVYLSPTTVTLSKQLQSRHLTLHGNYLFEYTSVNTTSDPIPLGFAHLENCKLLDIDATSFTLVVYRRPSRRSDLHTIVVKCPNKVRSFSSFLLLTPPPVLTSRSLARSLGAPP